MCNSEEEQYVRFQSREQIPIAEYEKFAEKLTCERFVPGQWARLAYRAGMRYCVFTSKHHDGFAMFDTDFDTYDIEKRSPYGKDVTAAIVEAMRSKGIRPCLYYSQAHDWHEPNAVGNTWDFPVPEAERDMWQFIHGKCKRQLKEILTKCSFTSDSLLRYSPRGYCLKPALLPDVSGNRFLARYWQYGDAGFQ